jgi:hypothetical protein
MKDGFRIAEITSQQSCLACTSAAKPWRVQDTVSQNPAEEGFGNERLITDAREVAAATGGFALIAYPGSIGHLV